MPAAADRRSSDSEEHTPREPLTAAPTTRLEPGNAAESLMIEKITDPNPKERMPPPDSGHSLTEKQIDLLRRWIARTASGFENCRGYIRLGSHPPARHTRLAGGVARMSAGVQQGAQTHR